MLDADAIWALLGEGTFVRSIRALGSVTSTNDIAWAWAAAGCPEGSVFFAEEQVLGRGRFGRSWHCPRGAGLLMSIVLRPGGPGVTAAHVTALTAVAAAEAIEQTAGLDVAIEWPNDLTVGGGKLGGVLVERRSGTEACVVGVGVNVNVEPDALPAEAGRPAASLSAAAGRVFEREPVAAALLGRLDARYGDATAGRWEAVAGAWQARCSLVGESAELGSAGAIYRGRVVAADPVAGIELELSRGDRRTFPAESTSVVHRPAR